MKQFLFLFVSIHIFLNMHLHAHGFRNNVMVDTSVHGKQSTSIKQLHHCVTKRKRNPSIPTMDVKKPANFFHKEIKAAARGTTNCYMKIWFDDNTKDDVVCTPLQEFYHAEKNSWMSGLELKAGDQVLSIYNRKKKIHKIEFVPESLEVYALEIDNTHTFFVGRHGVLTHNMALPLMISAGFSIPFGAGAVASTAAAGFFGPITLVGGLTLGVAAFGMYYLSDLPNYQYKVDIEIDSIANSFREQQKNNSSNPPMGNSSGVPEDPNDDKNKRKKNEISKTDFFKNNDIKKDYKSCRDGSYQRKPGAKGVHKDAEHLKWDHTHNDVEIFNARKQHIGSLDPATKQIYKGPVAGREFRPK